MLLGRDLLAGKLAKEVSSSFFMLSIHGPQPGETQKNKSK